MNENSKVLFEETIMLVGDEGSITEQLEFVKKKVGEKNVCFYDENCDRKCGYLFLNIRTTEEVFKDLRFHLNLEQVWA